MTFSGNGKGYVCFHAAFRSIAAGFRVAAAVDSSFSAVSHIS
jgi:hypothetical protein